MQLPIKVQLKGGMSCLMVHRFPIPNQYPIRHDFLEVPISEYNLTNQPIS